MAAMSGKDKRQLNLRIEELETAFDWLADASHMGFEDRPCVSFLDLTSGAVRSPEDEDEAEDLFGDANHLLLPGELFEGLHWGMLDEFVATLPANATRSRLVQAIKGKGAFRRFKDIVFGGGDVELKHNWLWFETRRKRQRIVQWLGEENIDPEWNCDIFEAPPLPNKRPELLRAVHDFVVAASKLPGVRRIALIGSLATNKAIPKDVDLLVEITDDMPLGALAKLSRQLAGRTMATGDSCGADVFLHNPLGEYLGRICIWKQCAPGIRLTCQARNCGRREYLCDDLDMLQLDPDLIQSPPLILWPSAAAGVESPDS
jgi:predicted nucleotidyltransferase